MKRAKLLLVMGSLWLFPAVHPAPVQAQPPVLGASLYAGVTITGAVSSVYAVEATTNLSQTNSWACVALVQLPATNYLWVDTSSPANGQRFYRAALLAPTNLVFIPPGTFLMGSPTNEPGRSTNEGPQTVVTLTKGFFMAQYLVTQTDYLAVVGSNPSHFTSDTNGPVDFETWVQATNYCALRTQRDTAAGLIPAGTEYRLPTEAEWEYACRALSSTEFYYGEDTNYTSLANYAWYSANSGGTTQPVGLKLPNFWGLYDMAGNVFEWCQDWYGPYSGGSTNDPEGAASGTERVLRGGSWFNSASFCRSAERDSGGPTGSNSNIGFRVVLAVGP
jgi:formylglycine-generating enzyme required for sulfatase activity